MKKLCSNCKNHKIIDNILWCFWHQPEAEIDPGSYNIALDCDGYEYE